MQIKPFPVKSLCLAPLASVPALSLAGLGSADAGVVSDLGVGLVFSVLLRRFALIKSRCQRTN